MFSIFGWTSTTEPAGSNLLVFQYGSKRIMAKRHLSYRNAIQTCHSLFPNLPKDCTITFNTKDLEICKNEMTEISEESWAIAVAQLDCVVVMVVEKEHSDLIDTIIGATGLTDGSDAYMKTITISVAYIDGLSRKLMYTVEVSPSSRIEKLLDVCSAKIGLPVNDLRFTYHGQTLCYGFTVQDYHFENGTQLTATRCMQEVRGPPMLPAGRKPIIYLYSPTPIEATVKLSLTAQWSFSAIYPIVPVKPRTQFSKEEISWKVNVHPNRDLTELTTGLNVAYLFWEAQTNPTVARPATPPPSPGGISSTEDVNVFYPNEADLNDSDSVVLSIDKITPYLDKALTALCLHTEARTSFITYWLPSLLKHKHVALRFVAQKSYEHAAPLAVSPTPDIVTRIFMVFKGVADDELSQWSAATERASEDMKMWQDIVGIDSERARDQTLFRVLEWGGMEVLGRTSS